MIDLIGIGDTLVDEFIELKEATITKIPDSGESTLSMAWGEKIPYNFATLVPAVGNAANAVVAAARLGLSTAYVTDIGKDKFGDEILETFAREGIDTRYVSAHDGIPTNHHYVLMYQAERTILIRHEQYPYRFPASFEAPKWIYLSSLAEHTESFHDEIAAWIAAHPETKMAFQPGTFQIRMGKDRLAALYRASELVACNKEEAEHILGLGQTDMRELLAKMHDLGPRIVLITDGPNGSYASDGEAQYRVPMYPDKKAPVDRTGAGDATTSTVVAALALGLPLKDALAWGPVNSMSVVQEVGAQKGLLSREAIEKLLTEAPADYKVETF